VIDELHIRGLGVIEDASLRLDPGLTVVTGETGAGKTMLVTALQLLLGGRSDVSLVRAGSDGALVEAVLKDAVAGADDWLDDPDDPLVVAREIPPDGRSRARISGRLAPVSALASLLGGVVEVHAQHEHVRLARTEVQRALLDRFAGEAHTALLARHRQQHAEWRAQVERRDRLQADAQERARELDRLVFEVREIEAAEIDPDVDGQLDGTIEVLASADEIRQGALEAAAALGGDGAQEALGVAVDALRRIPLEEERLDAIRSRLEALVAETADLATEARELGEQVEADPARLEALLERRHALSALKRKYGASLDEVVDYAARARERITALQADDADAGALDDMIDVLAGELDELVAALHDGRRRAGERLAATVDAHLDDLGMPHAHFAVDLESLAERTADGGDRVTFLLAPNPGEPARPLATAASGGERSRVSLAIEVALADVDDAQVLVFDEVDAGVGGTTAMAVGEKLARLATGVEGRPRQVLCVTHLAQLAAFADVHHVVEKQVVDGRTVTTSRQVADDERVAELARMLGGAARDEALEHARVLLDEATGRRGG
jgi:DNA repair protein RecN (Recombination protein N)